MEISEHFSEVTSIKNVDALFIFIEDGCSRSLNGLFIWIPDRSRE